jgi:recombinational DNA repair ATPase RecF
MKLPKTIVNNQMTKEQAILYYLFVDDQLTCAWWDYLEEWQEYKQMIPENNSQFQQVQLETMKAVEYWEDILDQLKKMISYEEIEDYIKEHPEIKKSYLFVR